MDSYMDYFPFSDRGGDLRRMNAKKFAKHRSKLMLKTMRDARKDSLLVISADDKSKRRKNAPRGEDICANVPYSMNRKYRFRDLTADGLIANALDEEQPIGVLEQWTAYKVSTPLASAFHEVTNELQIKTRAARRLTANANTLMEKPKPPRRKKKEVEVQPESAENQERMLVIITKCHPAPGKWDIPLKTGPKVRIRKHQVYEKSYSGSVEESEDDFVDHAGQDDLPTVDTRPRDSNFSLSEFIREKSAKSKNTANGDVPNTEQEKNEVCEVLDVKAVSPLFGLLEMPKQVRETGFRASTDVKISNLTESHFFATAKNMLASDTPSRRMVIFTRGCRSFAVQFYELDYLKQPTVFPIMSVIFEAPKDTKVRVHFDGAFNIPISKRVFRQQLLNSKPDSFEALVRACEQCLDRWKSLHTFFPLEKFAVPELAGALVEGVRYDIGLFPRALLTNVASMNDEQTLALLKSEYSKLESAKDESELFEVLPLEKNACVVCKCAVNGGMCSLNCLHDVCAECLRDSVIAQIRADAFPPLCPAKDCESAIPLPILQCVLPIPLFTYFVRRALVYTTKGESGEKVVSCPGCLQHGILVHPNFGAMCCKSCHTCSCVACASPPHWPLTCDEYKLWNAKVSPLYKLEALKAEGIFKEEMIVRRCNICDREMEGCDAEKQKRCSCWTHYDWSTGAFAPYYGKERFRWRLNPETHKYEEVIPLAKEVSKYKPTYTISRDYVRVCAEARKARMESTLSTESVNLNYFDVGKLAVYLVEFGTAWLYMHRDDEDELWREIRHIVNKITKHYPIAIPRPGDALLCKLATGSHAASVEKLHTLTDTLVALFERPLV